MMTLSRTFSPGAVGLCDEDVAQQQEHGSSIGKQRLAFRASAGIPAKSDGSLCRDARGGLFLQTCSRKKDHRFLIFHQLFLVVEAIHFEGPPGFAKIRPKTSAAFLSILAAFNASMRSCPGGMPRAA
jgi:hypothetical protein